jgi:hypothetical protein
MQHLVKKITVEDVLLFCDEGKLAGLDSLVGKDKWVVDKFQTLGQTVSDLRDDIAKSQVGGIQTRFKKEESLRLGGKKRAWVLTDLEIKYQSALEESQDDNYWHSMEIDCMEEGGDSSDSINFKKETYRLVMVQWAEKLAELESKRLEIEQEKRKMEKAVEKAQVERGMNYMRVRNALLLLKRDVSIVRSYIIA